jgi:hypothetical protein
LTGARAGDPTSGAVLSGTVTGGQLPVGSLSVSIKQGDWRDLAPGTTFALYPVPSNDVHIAGNTWAVSLDPATIPSKFVAPDGQVDFMLEAHDAETGLAAYHTVSAQRVLNLVSGLTNLIPAGDPVPIGWTPSGGSASLRPSAPPVEVSAPQFGGADAGTDNLEANMNTSTAVPDTGELTGIPLELIKDPTGSAVDDGGTTDAGTFLPSPETVDVNVAAPGNCQEIDPSRYRADIQTTIATGYPVGGDESSLTYTSALKTTSGTAIASGSGFRESGTESTTDGWGADFVKDPYKRSYRTNVTYGYFVCYNVAGYYSYWVFPIKQPGAAYYYYLSDAPNWTRCQPVYDGIVWKREQAGENAYESSYGVKAKGYIGIEMFSKHSYNKSGKLRYHVTHGNKRVCGNNDTPGQAGKVQEKF